MLTKSHLNLAYGAKTVKITKKTKQNRTEVAQETVQGNIPWSSLDWTISKASRYTCSEIKR